MFFRHLIDILRNLKERLDTMALNLDALTAAVTASAADTQTLIGLVKTLLAAAPDPTVQAKLDALTASLAASNTAAAAEIAAATPSSGPATGATGA